MKKHHSVQGTFSRLFGKKHGAAAATTTSLFATNPPWIFTQEVTSDSAGGTGQCPWRGELGKGKMRGARGDGGGPGPSSFGPRGGCGRLRHGRWGPPPRPDGAERGGAERAGGCGAGCRGCGKVRSSLLAPELPLGGLQARRAEVGVLPGCICALRGFECNAVPCRLV